MKDAKHTPGPWVYEGGMNADMMSCVTAPQSDEYTDIAYLTLPNHHANAHLIAAAPDLLEALDQLVIEYDEADLAHDEPTSLTSAVNAARAAIAKAKGKTT